tara:strand:- start:1351 stop:1662 length:312 start_codon:yes stop_codon:yes gene_type:complete
MKATIWKVLTEKKNEYRYKLQVEQISGKRMENRIKKALKDWDEAGYGFYRSNKKETSLLFARSFEDKYAMLEWAKTFPYELHEKNTQEKIKKIKTSYNRKEAK